VCDNPPAKLSARQKEKKIPQLDLWNVDVSISLRVCASNRPDGARGAGRAQWTMHGMPLIVATIKKELLFLPYSLHHASFVPVADFSDHGHPPWALEPNSLRTRNGSN
jgi:hypothetical protein